MLGSLLNTDYANLTPASLPRLKTNHPDRTQTHIARKLWHFLTGIALIGVYIFSPKPLYAVWIVSALLILVVTFESLRLKTPEINSAIIRFFGAFMRQHEERSMSTTPHYLLSTVMAFALFPKDVAILSILFLACADPIASYVGISWGKFGPKLAPNRSLFGTLAGLATCLIIGWIYWTSYATTLHTLNHCLILTCIGALGGCLAELLPLEVDDNLTIPIISGFSLWLGSIILTA